jgi:hypothetical protein
MSKKRAAIKPDPITKPGVIAMSGQKEDIVENQTTETATAAPAVETTVETANLADSNEPAAPAPAETTVDEFVNAEKAKLALSDKANDVYSFIATKYPALSDKTKLPLVVQSIIERLNAYVVGMGNNVPVALSDGIKFQKSLYNCFNAALDAKDGVHVLALDIICWYISEHRASAFSDRLSARFLEAEQFSNGVQGKFVAILNVLTIVSNPANRGKINKLVNMDSVSRTLNNTGLALALSNYVSAAR